MIVTAVAGNIALVICALLCARIMTRFAHCLLLGSQRADFIDLVHPYCFFQPYPCRIANTKPARTVIIVDRFLLVSAALSCALLWSYGENQFLIGQTVFFALLIISMTTDIFYLLISRYASLCAIPVGLLLAATHGIPISIKTSIAGTIFGYLFLYSFAKLALFITKQESIGQGDLELLALIGAFTGVLGVWASLCIGSVIGSLLSIVGIIFNKTTRKTVIPFGPFLALGSIIFVLFNTAAFF